MHSEKNCRTAVKPPFSDVNQLIFKDSFFHPGTETA
jgi:hypothetical protein